MRPQTAQFPRIRLVLVERNQLVLSALQHIFAHDNRFELTGHVESGQAFLEMIGINRANFDIVIVSSKLADMGATKLLTELRHRQAGIRIVIFSNDIGILKQCLHLGAHGFCYQFDDPAVLLDTLIAVANGHLCIPNTDMTKIHQTPLSTLTPREIELLGVLAKGWTNVQIATRMGISENTVKYHLRNLYDKIGVHNRAAAVALFFADIQR